MRPPTHRRTHTPSPLAPFFSPVMSFCKHPCSSKDIYFWPPANLFLPTSTDPPDIVAIFHTLTQPFHLDSILWGVLDPHPLSFSSHCPRVQWGAPPPQKWGDVVGPHWGANAQLQSKSLFLQTIHQPTSEMARPSYIWVQHKRLPWWIGMPFTTHSPGL